MRRAWASARRRNAVRSSSARRARIGATGAPDRSDARSASASGRSAGVARAVASSALRTPPRGRTSAARRRAARPPSPATSGPRPRPRGTACSRHRPRRPGDRRRPAAPAPGRRRRPGPDGARAGLRAHVGRAPSDGCTLARIPATNPARRGARSDGGAERGNSCGRRRAGVPAARSAGPAACPRRAPSSHDGAIGELTPPSRGCDGSRARPAPPGRGPRTRHTRPTPVSTSAVTAAGSTSAENARYPSGAAPTTSADSRAWAERARASAIASSR